MQDNPTIARRAGAHLAGIVLYILIALAGTLAYLLTYKLTGPRIEPLVGGALVVFLPMLMTGFGLAWALIWGLLKWKRGEVMPREAALYAAALTALGMIVICGGFACFFGGKSEHYVGWFFAGTAALATAAHAAIYRRITRRAGT